MSWSGELDCRIVNVAEKKGKTSASSPDVIGDVDTASGQPDLGEKLSSQETQQAIDVYFANRSAVFEPYRKLMTRCLSLQTGSTVTSFADQSNFTLQCRNRILCGLEVISFSTVLTSRLARTIFKAQFANNPPKRIIGGVSINYKGRWKH